MLIAILIILILLWVLGYGPALPFVIPSVSIFVFNGHTITLWNIIIFLVILWAIGILPRPFREIASVIFVLWVLSTLGILAFAGLSSLLIVALIIGVLVSLIGA